MGPSVESSSEFLIIPKSSNIEMTNFENYIRSNKVLKLDIYNSNRYVN